VPCSGQVHYVEAGRNVYCRTCSDNARRAQVPPAEDRATQAELSPHRGLPSGCSEPFLLRALLRPRSDGARVPHADHPERKPIVGMLDQVALEMHQRCVQLLPEARSILRGYPGYYSPSERCKPLPTSRLLRVSSLTAGGTQAASYPHGVSSSGQFSVQISSQFWGIT
jgi:hypothetical protein